MSGLVLATIGSLTTELSAIAGIAEAYGLTRALVVPATATMLLAVIVTGSYRRVERIAIFVGLFELAFLVVGWISRPDLATVAKDVMRLPLGDPDFIYLAMAVIGATFNPWMVFYQQSAVIDKQLKPSDYQAARWDTGCGAILTQLLTGAILVAVAAGIGAGDTGAGLSNIGDIAGALTAALGKGPGCLVFSIGVLGAALVAAIVSSLALAWGMGEAAGCRRALERRPSEAPWFYGVYAGCLVIAAALVGAAVDLVALNIAAQLLNAFLLPLVIGVLLKLALTALPQAVRPSGWYKAVLIGSSVFVSVAGVVGASWALL
jgi:Mn2+/Fe2+ NRAMP family transporter